MTRYTGPILILLLLGGGIAPGEVHPQTPLTRGPQSVSPASESPQERA